MRVIRYHEKGAPEVMRVEDVPTPEPGPGELLLSIEAASVAYGDVLRRSGRHYPIPTVLPHVPGSGVAGVVKKVGEGVDSALVGKRVYGSVRTGGYAEFGVGAASEFMVLPDEVGPVEAVSILGDGATAALILRTVGQLQPGQSVFVPAAAGGLGSIALQLARLYGAAKVFGGASSSEKRDTILALGADAAIDYMTEGWSKRVIDANGGKGVDLALEMTGGPVFYETLEIVAPGGRIVNYGNASDTDSPVNPRLLLRKNLTLSGFMAWHYIAERDVARREVLEFLQKGLLKVDSVTYCLADAPEAHRAVETRASKGRQVVLPHA